MAHLGLQSGIWVLICDGRKALFLENMGDHVYPKLQTREILEHKDLQTHDLGSDVPGRIFSGKNGRPAAIEPTDLHDEAERAFLTGIAHRVNRSVEDGNMKKLIVSAPARALAVLRSKFSAATQRTLQAEFDKDFVRMPIYEIERHLLKLLSK